MNFKIGQQQNNSRKQLPLHNYAGTARDAVLPSSLRVGWLSLCRLDSLLTKSEQLSYADLHIVFIHLLCFDLFRFNTKHLVKPQNIISFSVSN